MTCCIVGVLVAAGVLWVKSFVRYRLLGHPRPPDPTAWRLELPPDPPRSA